MPLICCVHLRIDRWWTLLETDALQENVPKWENQLTDLVFHTANIIFMDHIDPLLLLLKPKMHPVIHYLCCALGCTGFIFGKILGNSFSFKDNLNYHPILKNDPRQKLYYVIKGCWGSGCRAVVH